MAAREAVIGSHADGAGDLLDVLQQRDASASLRSSLRCRLGGEHHQQFLVALSELPLAAPGGRLVYVAD